MDFIEVLKGRRSIRSFLPQEVPEEDIREIVELATLAPSAGNKQDWQTIAIFNREIKLQMKKVIQDKLATLAKQAGVENPEAVSRRRINILFADAPVALVILTKPYRSLQDEILVKCGYTDQEVERLRMRPELQTIGGFIQSLLLAAYSYGYGTCWMVAPNVARPEMEQILGVKKPWSISALVALGRPAKEPGRKIVKPVSEVLKIIN
ncbi:MAG: nitroreductase family protein [Firmicutes bacterium]|nr:nitroreductase family protein [Bacillota bacterium]